MPLDMLHQMAQIIKRKYEKAEVEEYGAVGEKQTALPFASASLWNAGTFISEIEAK